MDSFNVGRFLFLPGRKVWGVIIKSELQPEVLKEISDLGYRHGVITPTIQYNFVDSGKVVALGFVDLTDADVSIEELVKEIRKIKGVTSVQILHPTANGFVADYLSTRLLLAGDRAIILRRPGYDGLIAGMREQFGTAGEVFLYYTGYNAGMKYGKSHQEFAAKMGIEDPIQIIQKISIPLCVSMGFGKPEIVEAGRAPPKVVLRIYECFECEVGVGAKNPYSHFMRGILAGLLAQLFSRRMEARELQCIARGDSYCEFKIAPE